MTNQRKQQIISMLRDEPADTFLQYALAIEHEKDGDVAEAVSSLERLKNQAPEYLGLYLKLATLLVDSNRLEDAIEVLKQGIIVAQQQGNRKAQGELNELLLGLED